MISASGHALSLYYFKYDDCSLLQNYHIWPKNPELSDDVQHGEGHGEGAEEEVRDGQVGNEDVPGSQEHLGS